MHGLKKVSIKDLQKSLNSGAEVLHEKETPLDLSGITEQLQELVAKEPDNADILAAIGQLVEAISNISITVNPTDLKPVLDAVRLIKSQAIAPTIIDRKPTAYKFEMVRDNRSLLASVVATPIER